MNELLRVAIGVLVAQWVASGAASVIVPTVGVGNAGNAGDVQGQGTFGGVDDVYNIGTFEISAGQYTEFLNAVADTDTYSLYATTMFTNGEGCKIERAGSAGSYTYSVAADYADRPVNYVNWGDAARFANWMHNGQPTGAQGLTTTEDGSYFLNGATTTAALNAAVRKLDATWVIPTEHEWYKAAYHKNDGVTGNYWDYATSSDITPSNDLISPDPGNSACFRFAAGDDTIGAPYWRTLVGDFENSASPYGTFDQTGNVAEWTEGLSGTSRAHRGGGYTISGPLLVAANRGTAGPTTQSTFLGFRLGLIPEPSTIVLLAVGSVAVLRRRR